MPTPRPPRGVWVSALVYPSRYSFVSRRKGLNSRETAFGSNGYLSRQSWFGESVGSARGQAPTASTLPTLWSEVAAQLRVAIRPPFDILGAVVVNTTILLFGWFLLGPRSVTNTESLAFLPFAIAVWAFADVSATNVLGANPAQTLAALDQPPVLRRRFTVRHLTLVILISPACVALSLLLAPSLGRPLTALAVALAVVAMPFGFFGLASVAGALFPYHPIPLRQRIRRRGTWPRWFAALGAPVLVAVPAAVLTLLVPALLFRLFVFDETLPGSVFNPDFVFGVENYLRLTSAVFSVLWSLLLWRVGLRITGAVITARKDYLRDFLRNPNRG